MENNNPLPSLWKKQDLPGLWSVVQKLSRRVWICNSKQPAYRNTKGYCLQDWMSLLTDIVGYPLGNSSDAVTLATTKPSDTDGAERDAVTTKSSDADDASEDPSAAAVGSECSPWDMTTNTTLKDEHHCFLLYLYNVFCICHMACQEVLLIAQIKKGQFQTMNLRLPL